MQKDNVMTPAWYFYQQDLKHNIPVGSTKRIIDELVLKNVIEIKIEGDVSIEAFVDKHLEDYRKYFSKRYCGISRMGSPDKCKVLMIKFFKTYDYNWETVLKATEFYIKERLNSNRPDLISHADNFIFWTDVNGESSRLAKYCNIVTDDLANRRHTNEHGISI